MWSAEHILRNTRDQLGFPGGGVVKNPPADADDARESGSIPGPIRSPGEGNGNPLQHSSIEIESSMVTKIIPRARHPGVKWALESITTNKASGGDGIPVELFQILKEWKCCTQYTSKFGKLSSGHRTGKGQFSFQSQRKAMPKNAQTIAQLHSSHTLVK